jgi:hypothetical protein
MTVASGPAIVLVLALLGGCIDLANLRAAPDGGGPSGAGGALSSPGSGGAIPTGTGGAGAIAGSSGATTPRPGTFSVEVRDLDADGTNEVIVVDNTAGLPMVFEAEAGQPVGQPLPGPFAGRVVFGDFDGDGSTDLAFLSVPSPLVPGSGAPVQVLVTLNSRLVGAFAPPVVYDMVGMRADLASPSLAALDVDGDGRLDLQVLGNGLTDLLMNDGHGAFRIVAPTVAPAALEPAAGCKGCGAVNPVARPGQ